MDILSFYAPVDPGDTHNNAINNSAKESSKGTFCIAAVTFKAGHMADYFFAGLAPDTVQNPWFKHIYGGFKTELIYTESIHQNEASMVKSFQAFAKKHQEYQALTRTPNIPLALKELNPIIIQEDTHPATHPATHQVTHPAREAVLDILKQKGVLTPHLHPIILCIEAAATHQYNSLKQ